MSSADVIEALLETEEPEPGDVEAYAEAEGELERGELKPFKRC